MKKQAVFCAVLVIGFVFGLALAADLTAQEKETATVIIPKEIRSIFDEGMETRQARTELPFTIIQHLFLPAQQNMHNIFFFKVKNADLGFTAVTPQAPTEEKEEQEESSFQESPAQLQSSAHLFLYFKQLDGEYSKEVYVPVRFLVDGASFQPEEELTCSVGYPMPMGKYILAMAIALQDMETRNLSRIGTQYFEFSTPVAQDMQAGLITTPVFFVENLGRMAQPETTTEIHKDYFTYSVLQVTPNLEKTFKAGDNLDIFFFVFGAQPNESQQYDLSVNYQVMKGEEVAIKYADTKYQNPLVSQPLPLKKTVVTTTTTESGESKEKKETKDLESGDYALKIIITDAVSGKSLEKIIDFTMK